jgi:hypothetical protein
MFVAFMAHLSSGSDVPRGTEVQLRATAMNLRGIFRQDPGADQPRFGEVNAD